MSRSGHKLTESEIVGEEKGRKRSTEKKFGGDNLVGDAVRTKLGS